MGSIVTIGYDMFDLDWAGWLVVGFCAFVVGVSKTGLPGLGILHVPLMAMVLPKRESTGILLGMLILGDLFAATYYRRRAEWKHVLRLLAFLPMRPKDDLETVWRERRIKRLLRILQRK